MKDLVLVLHLSVDEDPPPIETILAVESALHPAVKNTVVNRVWAIDESAARILHTAREVSQEVDA